MNKILINSRKELTQYWKDIEALFFMCFQKKIDFCLWEWAYIKNPYGEPVVSLYYDEKKLVGHYAVIPFGTVVQGQKINSVLSMTTMVHPDFRGCGIFVSQAEDVYDFLISNKYDLVFGFPNNNSTPGFTKRLGWKVNYWKIARIYGKDIVKNRESIDKFLNLNRCLAPDFTDKAKFDWRISKTNMIYKNYQNLILKEFGENNDIVLAEKDFYKKIENEQIYSVYLPSLENIPFIDSFNYNNGYKILNRESDSFFNTDTLCIKDLILSDVF